MSQKTRSPKTPSGDTPNEPVYHRTQDGVDGSGVLPSCSLGRLAGMRPEEIAREMADEPSFAPISDSHMGFNKAANSEVAGTLRPAVEKINGSAVAPEFLLNTRDISHLSKPEEFDTVKQILSDATPNGVFYVPGKHDLLNDNGQPFLKRYGKDSKGAGWYSSDKKGVHFVGLVNVVNLKAGGLGTPDSPGPMKLPMEQPKSVLGITDVNFVRGGQGLGLVDSTLA